jgi:hypothetical protein
MSGLPVGGPTPAQLLREEKKRIENPELTEDQLEQVWAFIVKRAGKGLMKPVIEAGVRKQMVGRTVGLDDEGYVDPTLLRPISGTDLPPITPDMLPDPLDADTLDGKDSTAFALASHTQAFSTITGVATDAQIPASIARDAEVFGLVLAGDGAGSDLDSDTLDGLHGNQFSRGTSILGTLSTGGTTPITQLAMNIPSVPAGGWISLPAEQRFFFAYGTGGNNSYAVLFLYTNGTIGNLGAAGITIGSVTSGDYFVWDAASSTYRMGNGTGASRAWRVLSMRA